MLGRFVGTIPCIFPARLLNKPSSAAKKRKKKELTLGTCSPPSNSRILENKHWSLQDGLTHGFRSVPNQLPPPRKRTSPAGSFPPVPWQPSASRQPFCPSADWDCEEEGLPLWCVYRSRECGHWRQLRLFESSVVATTLVGDLAWAWILSPAGGGDCRGRDSPTRNQSRWLFHYRS